MALAVSLGSWACGGEREGGPGTLTATLVSPHAGEGALYASVVGSGVLDVRSVDARTYSHVVGDTAWVVVVREEPGELRFAVEVADTRRLPGVTVLEVADGENRLRPGLQGYRLELRP